MTITASSAQVANQPIQNGNRTLNTTPNVTGASATGTAITVYSDKVGFTITPTGTLDNASVIEMQAQINGSSFFPVFVGGTKKSWTGTQINTASGGATGIFETIDIKAVQIRFVMSTVGTTSGTNGVVIRILD